MRSPVTAGRLVAMNLKRGLLRLWVVLTLIWVTGAAWLLWDELTVTKHVFLLTASNTTYELSGPTGATREEALEKFKSRIEAGQGAKPEDRAALLAEIRAFEEGPWTKYSSGQGAAPHDPNAVSGAQKSGGDSTAPIRVESADGVIHEFPAGTSMDVVDRVMKQYAQSNLASNPQWPRLPVNPPEHSSKLAELRQKYSEYNDMSDSAFADALYRKYYSDMPRDQFNAKMGLTGERLTITDEFVANWPRRWQTVAAVALPPLAVLVVGVGLFWAAQGFRTRSV